MPEPDTEYDQKAWNAKEDADTNTNETFSTPVTQFRLCGVKRENESVLRITYVSRDQERIAVPMLVKDTKMSFLARRDQMLKQMFDDNRSEVYCSWRDALLSVLVKDTRLILYRDSLQQKKKRIHRIHVYSSPRARPHTRLAGSTTPRLA